MSGYAKYQIVDIPPTVVTIGKSDYPRPFLIIEILGESMYVLPFTSKVEMFYDQSRDFFIYSGEDGFALTGLDCDSVVRNQEFRVSAKSVFKIRGCLEGDILERFDDFAKRVDL